MQKIVFTCGDINGIGPEIILKTIKNVYDPLKYKLYIIIPENVFNNVYQQSGFKLNYRICDFENITSEISPQIVDVVKLNDVEFEYGKPNKNSGLTSYISIKTSFLMLEKKFADAVITAPISKESLKLAGINFPGHTEMFAEHFKSKNYNMMFISNEMKCALLTIHTAIKDVPQKITHEKLDDTFRNVINTLKIDFNLQKPNIAVLGLNPHAGESGILGSEEVEIITPSIKNSQYKSFLNGPFVPDAFFGNKLYKNYDCIIGMYHDQVLIPFKMLNFDTGVNYTSGLPIIRTSPDHGTAFDIAGEFIANEKSMIEAFNLASNIITSRQNNE